MANLPRKLQKKLSERDTNNALRRMYIPDGLVDFSSNDYLGLAQNKALFKSTSEILKARGIQHNGATGSRLLSGNSMLYRETEEFLKQFYKAPSALVYNSGYDANLGFFSAVPQRNDYIFYDELAHASIRDGIKLSNAKSYKFEHNNIEDLERKISRSFGAQSRTEESEVYIVTESVFSMDGDSPELADLINFCTKNNFHLIVDEAHAVGVFGAHGEGLLPQLQLENSVFARIVTFGKAAGVHGAAILGSEALMTFLINFTRSFIYSTGLPPHSLAAILAAHEALKGTEAEELRTRLTENCMLFQEQLNTRNLKPYFIKSDSAIQSCIIPTNDRVKNVAEKLQALKFDVRPILSPTVPQGFERLRFCLHSFNSKKEISEVLAILAVLLQADLNGK